MTTLAIGSDRALFNPASEARMRNASYARVLGETHVVIFSLRSHELTETHDGPLHIYPTNSRSRLMYVFDAARIARRLPSDIVTTQDPFESGLAGLLARKARPLHVQLHTDPFVKGFRTFLLNRVRLLIARVVVRRAARVRTVSHAIARALQQRYPALTVTVLPIFVDVAAYKSLVHKPHPRFKTTLLWMGRFEQEKNPSLAIRALAEVRKRHPDTGLVVLGTGRLEADIKQLTETLKVGEWVEFKGWQSPAEFLTMAHLVLVTSHYEGYGRQIVEALAAGVPVLSTDVGVAREAGAIVTSEHEFASALGTWFTNGPRTAELKDYPYQNFNDYVDQYCADIKATVKK